MGDTKLLIPPPKAISFPAFTTPRYIGNGLKGVFARTASRALVKLVASLNCTKCQKPFTSNTPPLTAHCGHHFCAQCVDDAFFFNGQGRSARDLRWDSYECKGCKKSVTAPVPEKSKNSFIPNKFLAEFLNALDEPGYRCKNCHQLHPRNNAVALAGLSAIVCVWCAAEKHLIDDLEVIGANHEVTEKNGGERLQSVDRIHKESVASGLIQCSFCAMRFCELLASIGISNKGGIEAFPLPCGHFQHSLLCDSLRKMEATCNLCPEEFSFVEVDKAGHVVAETNGAFTPRTNPQEIRNLLDGASGATGELKQCKKCEMLHPPDNFEKTKKEKCVWCALETQSAKFKS